MFKRHLESNEIILVAGEANWVQRSETYGRGAGEGVLIMTNRALLFAIPGSEVFHRVANDSIERIWKTFIVLPNFSEIHFKVDSKAHASFYATKRTCREITSLARSVGIPK